MDDQPLAATVGEIIPRNATHRVAAHRSPAPRTATQRSATRRHAPRRRAPQRRAPQRITARGVGMTVCFDCRDCGWHVIRVGWPAAAPPPTRCGACAWIAEFVPPDEQAAVRGHLERQRSPGGDSGGDSIPPAVR
jgi:hypothetical protein